MGKYGVIDFDEDEIEAAGHWYHDLYLTTHGAYRPGYEGSMLYAIMGRGALLGMADRSSLIDRAERLEREAMDAARIAATKAKNVKGGEKKELLADVKGLRSIAQKARRFVRDEVAKPRAHHATKKSAAQLQREIDDALAKPKAGTVRRCLLTVNGAVVQRHLIQKRGT